MTSAGDGSERAPTEFPPASRRTAFALQLNVQAMCEEFGIERVGFLTLTFADHVLLPREAQRRLNSLTTNVLRPRYGRIIRVIERQKSGRIHYHLLVALGADIRTGCDFNAFARGDYRSASPVLRAEWAFWRRTAKEYGFGRTELLPVKSTTEAIGQYVGKYIAKHLNWRQVRDKGIRLVSYSGGKVASTRFAWASGGAAQWRQKLGAFVHMLYEAQAIDEPSMVAMNKRFGPHWAWKWRDSILTFPLEHTTKAGNEDECGSESETGGGESRLLPTACGPVAHGREGEGSSSTWADWMRDSAGPEACLQMGEGQGREVVSTDVRLDVAASEV